MKKFLFACFLGFLGYLTHELISPNKSLFSKTANEKVETKKIQKWSVVETKNPATGRSECGMAACNGKLYLLGGDGSKNIEVFDPVTAMWTKKSEAPTELGHFQPVTLGNKIYVLEAFCAGGFPNQKNLENVVIYDTEKDTWSNGAGLPAERSRASAGAVSYEGKFYLVAGIQHGHSSGTTNMFDVYDPQTNKWMALADAPHMRDHCAGAVVKDKLYIAGGRNTSYHEPNNFMAFFSKTVLEVDCYDFKTGTWSTLSAKLPLGSGGGSIVNLNDVLYYMGGERATDTERNAARKNVFSLDPSTTNAWQIEDSLKQARNGMAAAVLNNKIYVFGGEGGGASGGPPPMNTAGQQKNMLPPKDMLSGPRPAGVLEVFSKE